jgi:glutamate synthase domain-containing protein 3
MDFPLKFMETVDYLGKGLSGGKLIIRFHQLLPFKPEENIIIGNVAL